ncbi:hypothetical protein TRVA0_043S01068 [Trichomonascus vanleenenianus]|uniref:uncharacterized protein n=1 Tax=Trichomonascus vanleenenianus TaxID=2268995 RepID=UPI003EC958A5
MGDVQELTVGQQRAILLFTGAVLTTIFIQMVKALFRFGVMVFQAGTGVAGVAVVAVVVLYFVKPELVQKHVMPMLSPYLSEDFSATDYIPDFGALKEKLPARLQNIELPPQVQQLWDKRPWNKGAAAPAPPASPPPPSIAGSIVPSRAKSIAGSVAPSMKGSRAPSIAPSFRGSMAPSFRGSMAPSMRGSIKG